MGKKITVACTACQRRKVKCVGNPCAYCLKKNYICEFKEATKRGPKSIKFPTNLKDDVLNYVQESMGMMCLQQNFVDFYFHFIGISIPNSYKPILLSSVNKSIRSQVYIITASIMQLYGDKEQETLYISKAHRASSLFESDTVESAISLMMMARYLGHETTKGKNQLRLALSTLKLPTIESSPITGQAIAACESTLLLHDSSISKEQKSNYILSGLMTMDLNELAQTHPSSEIVTVGTAVIANLTYTLGKLDDSNVSTLLFSISTIMLAQDRTTILEYINKFSNVLPSLSNLPSSVESYARFVMYYAQFIVEWKSGNNEVAFQLAKKTIDTFQSNTRAIAIKVGSVLRLLLLPFYFQGCGALESVGPLLQLIEDACATDEVKEQKRRLWEELCGNLQSYNIGVLEKELFGELADPLVPLSASIAPFSPAMFIEECGCEQYIV